MSRPTDDELADAATYAIYHGLRIPVRDQIMRDLTPCQREEWYAALDRHRTRIQ